MSSTPRWLHALALVALTVGVIAADARAQDRGRGSDDDDRGRGDSRDGFRGPPFGGGGFPGGGFPGGGFPGGGFPGRGGPYGGSSYGGSSSGGSSGFLRSMDANSNGVIEPSEISDRSRSFLERMARDAGLDLNRPIPISRLEEAMRSRSSGSSGSSSSSSGSRGSSSGSQTTSLVPGFGPDGSLPLILGFGGTDPGLWVSPTGKAPTPIGDRDREEARDSIRRYDRNNDNILDTQEARNGRFSDDPLKYDKNGDGRLTQEELAQRYADRRANDDDRRRGDSRGGSSSSSRFSGGPGGPFGGSSGGPPGGGPFGGSFRGGPSSGGSPFGGSSFGRGGPTGGSPFGGGSSGGDSGDRMSMFAGMMFSRYDRNQNGSIEGDEMDGLSERYDTRALDGNGDRRISRDEFTSRISSASRSSSGGGSGFGGGPGGGGPPFSFRGGDGGDRGDGSRFSSRGSGDSRSSGRGERSSDSGRSTSSSASASSQPSRFLTAHERLPEGIPSWFRDKDANRDGQIGMNEFAADWSESTAIEFLRYDANGDGVLVPDEVLAGPSDSHLPGGVATSSSAAPSFAGSSSSFSLVTRSSSAPAASTANLEEKYKKFAEGMFKMYDKNQDGGLEPAEWSQMRTKPDNADTDGDGKVSVDELAAFLQGQYTKK